MSKEEKEDLSPALFSMRSDRSKAIKIQIGFDGCDSDTVSMRTAAVVILTWAACASDSILSLYYVTRMSQASKDFRQINLESRMKIRHENDDEVPASIIVVVVQTATTKTTASSETIRSLNPTF